MDKKILFQVLSAQAAPALLDLLGQAYDAMTDEQRLAVFGTSYTGAESPEVTDEEYEVDGEILLNEIGRFQQQSLAGAYYVPFRVDSRNFRHVPDETKEWFATLGDMLEACCWLSEHGDHAQAVACFGPLYALMDALEKGQEIVFAEEVGMWMLPADRKQCQAAYITSLAATATPEEFTQAVLPLIQRDAWQSFSTRGYATAIGAATAAQRTYLEAEIQRQKLRTAPGS